jgi:hypothetical protein
MMEKKKALSLPVSDVVYVFDDAEGGLYSNFLLKMC